MSATHTVSGLKVYIKPDELWEFFMLNRERLRKEMCCVAENTETGYEVRLDISSDYPVLRIFYHGEPQNGSYVSTQKEAAPIMQRLIMTQLCPVEETNDSDEAENDNDIDYSDEDMGVLQAMIDMREGDLDTAVSDFISTLLNRPVDETLPEDLNEAVLECVCKMLARRFKITVFRPTWIEKTGTSGHVVECYVEYPYLDEEKPGVIVGEPSSYQDALEYIDYMQEETGESSEFDPDEFPVT